MSSVQGELTGVSVPLVTLCVTAYNRPEPLKACLESFWSTCTYPFDSIELVIVDNASTDERVKSYLAELQPPCRSFKLLKRVENDYPIGQKRARIEAREAAEGDYFIDCPDDQLFVLRCDWVQEGIEHIKDDGTVGCIVHYAQPRYRFDKANNEMRVHPKRDRYFESLRKGYADYHLMSRAAYDTIGPYRPELGRECEGDYMERSHALGFRRNLLRYPVSIINDLTNPHELAGALELDEIQGACVQLDRPPANEELVQLAISKGCIQPIQSGEVVMADDEELQDWLDS